MTHSYQTNGYFSDDIFPHDLDKSVSPPIESHPFPPFLPPHATVMMMGSMPPTPDKWGMAFHYPNYSNDMWRIYGRVFFDDADYFRSSDETGYLKGFDAERIKTFMSERGIASCPTVRRAIREQGNASDKHLTIVETVDFDDILPQVPNVQTLFTTGGKATEILLALLPEDTRPKLPKTNQQIDYHYRGPKAERDLTLYRLPSTSRAYPLSLDNKVAAWRTFFEQVGLI